MKYTKSALLVFVLLAFLYGYFSQDAEANGNSRLGLIFAVVHEGRLTIDSYHNAEGTSTIDKAFANGHYYSDKAIGTAVFGTIVYAPLALLMKLSGHELSLYQIKYILTLAVIAIPSAFAGSLVYLVCETLSGSRLRAYLATLAVTLGTMCLPFSAVFFGHQLAGSLLFISFFLIFQLKLRPDLRQRWGYLFLTGLVMGAAFLTEYTTPVVLLPLALYYIYILRERWSLRWLRSIALAPLAGAAIPLAILMIYNTLCFGSPFSIGYEHLANEYQPLMAQGIMGINLPRLDALYYLTFHPAEGLFWQSPVLLAALAGFVFLWRDRRWRLEGAIALLAFSAYLLVNAGFHYWWGGFTFGPRYIIPMLLFLAIPLVMVPVRFSPLVILLSVISILEMFIPLAGKMLVPIDYFVNPERLIPFKYSPIFNYSWPQLLAGNFAPNLGEKILGLKNWLVLLPNLLAILAVTGIFLAAEKRLTGQSIQSRQEEPAN